MRSRTKWVVAGGAAAFVLTPIIAVAGSSALDTDLQQDGVVVERTAAKQTRAAGADAAAKAQQGADAKPTAKPSKASDEAAKDKAAKVKAAKDKAAKDKAKATKEPTGKKTVSAASPISPQSPDTAD